MMRSVLAAAILAAGTIVSIGPGCRNLEKTESFNIPNPMVVRPERPLADVPVPLGFTFKENGSYVFSGNYRVARLLYRGTPHIEECVEYFKEQMPRSHWMFVREAGVDDRVVTFHNEAEELRIQMVRSGGITALDIEIKPRPT